MSGVHGADCGGPGGDGAAVADDKLWTAFEEHEKEHK